MRPRKQATMRKLPLYCGIAAATTLAAIGAAAYVNAKPERPAWRIEVLDDQKQPTPQPKPRSWELLVCAPNDSIGTGIGEFGVRRTADGGVELMQEAGGAATAKAAVDKFVRSLYPGAESHPRWLVPGGGYGVGPRQADGPKLVVGVMRIGDRYVVGSWSSCSSYAREMTS
jgi:hypothetical protein